MTMHTQNSPLDKSSSSSSRRCGCGCGGDLPSTASVRQLYLTGHRQRRYQRQRAARVREALAAVGTAASVKTTPSGADTGRRRRTKKPSRTRYALVGAIDPRTLTILGEVTATSKRSAERDLRITHDPDTFLVAASHLPEEEAR
jgi:hypothetical protein